MCTPEMITKIIKNVKCWYMIEPDDVRLSTADYNTLYMSLVSNAASTGRIQALQIAGVPIIMDSTVKTGTATWCIKRWGIENNEVLYTPNPSSTPVTTSTTSTSTVTSARISNLFLYLGGIKPFYPTWLGLSTPDFDCVYTAAFGHSPFDKSFPFKFLTIDGIDIYQDTTLLLGQASYPDLNTLYTVEIPDYLPNTNPQIEAAKTLATIRPLLTGQLVSSAAAMSLHGNVSVSINHMTHGLTGNVSVVPSTPVNQVPYKVVSRGTGFVANPFLEFIKRSEAPLLQQVNCLCCGSTIASKQDVDQNTKTLTVLSNCCGLTESKTFSFELATEINSKGGWTAFLS